MINTIISTIVTTIVGAIIGSLITLIAKQKNKIIKLKERDELQNQALMIMLQTNLMNTYILYSKKKQIPDYVLRNWKNELKIYENLGGDDFIHTLDKHIDNFEIIHTDILMK